MVVGVQVRGSFSSSWMVVVNSRHLGVKTVGFDKGLDREVKEWGMSRMAFVSNLHSWEDGGICPFLVKENEKRSRFGVDEGKGQGGRS